MNDSSNARLARGGQYAPRPFDVHILEGSTPRLDDDADQMDDGAGVANQERQHSRIREVAGHELDREVPQGVGTARVSYQGSHRMSAPCQQSGKVPSHESGGSGNGDQHMRGETQLEVVPPSSRNTSVLRRATTVVSAS